MKAKVLLTGEIIDVEFFEQRGTAMTDVYIEVGTGRTFYDYELEFLTEELLDEDKHWQDVRERAAIAALQGLCANPKLIDRGTFECLYDISVWKAVEYADVLVEQLKQKRI